MRIVSGKHRGRILQSPDNDLIRPTSDKVRLALFNALNSRGAVVDAVVLDAFCGTGALSLEALSQGAERGILIDSDKNSLTLAKKNAEILKESGKCHFIQKDATKIDARPDNLPQATLCFLDPPYRRDLLPKVIEALKAGHWLADGCWIVAEMEAEYELKNFAADSDKTYGETKILIGQI